jgi:hydroxyacylglutathione hydrolase
VKLSDEVYLVGGGDAGFNLSDARDCNIYLINGGDELALIDVGVGDGIDQILDNVRADGLDPKRIRQLVVTHYHVDHAAGLAAARKITEATTYAPAGAVPAITKADEVVTGMAAFKKAGYYPPEYSVAPCAVDVGYSEGQSISIGELELSVIDTPGHCNSHCALLLKGRQRTYLFSGDCLFWGGKILIQNIWDCDLQAYLESVRTLAATDFDALLPGHLTFSLRDGHRHAQAALDTMKRGGVPPQLVNF